MGMTQAESFQRVLAAARAGAEWAWTNLYRDLAPIVLGYVRTRGAPDAEEVTGEVFADVVRNIATFEGNERDLRSWVLTIAHRRLVDALRRNTRRLEMPHPDPPDFPGGHVEDEALERVGTGGVAGLIRKLTPDQQEVLLMRILGDMTIDEIARALGKRRGAVKALQRRALATLRKEMSGRGVPL
jgi:RNA polymerase sigma factor (sigma-70 family)